MVIVYIGTITLHRNGFSTSRICVHFFLTQFLLTILLPKTLCYTVYVVVKLILKECFLMHIESLKYLLAVQQTGSIRKAAEQSNTSYQNISKIIKQLESELQVQLFDRTSQGMLPTPEAQPAFAFAANTLENYAMLLEHYQPIKMEATISGTVVISVFNYTSYLLKKVLNSFIPQYPQIQIEIKETNTMDKNIENIGIIPQLQGKHFPNIEKVIPLKEEPVSVLVKKNSPLGKQKSITLKKFSQYPTIIYSNYGYEGSIYYYLFRDKISLKYPPLIVNDIHNLKLYVKSGNYIALVPPQSPDEQEKDVLHV